MLDSEETGRLIKVELQLKHLKDTNSEQHKAINESLKDIATCIKRSSESRKITWPKIFTAIGAIGIIFTGMWVFLMVVLEPSMSAITKHVGDGHPTTLMLEIERVKGADSVLKNRVDAINRYVRSYPWKR